MRHPLKWTPAWALCLTLSWLACSEEPDTTRACEEGAQCGCGDGRFGYQRCESSAVFAECVCDGDVGPGDAGSDLGDGGDAMGDAGSDLSSDPPSDPSTDPPSDPIDQPDEGGDASDVDAPDTPSEDGDVETDDPEPETGDDADAGPSGPLATQGFAATVEGDNVDLSWSNPTNDAFAEVILVRYDATVGVGTPFLGTDYGVGDDVGQGTVLMAGTDEGYLDEDVACDDYTYRTYTRDESLAWSTAQEVHLAPDDFTSTVTDVSAGEDGLSVTIDWDVPVEDSNLETVFVVRSTDGPSEDTDDGTLVCTACPACSPCQDIGPPSGELWYTAFGCNDCGGCGPGVSDSIEFFPPEITDHNIPVDALAGGTKWLSVWIDFSAPVTGLRSTNVVAEYPAYTFGFHPEGGGTRWVFYLGGLRNQTTTYLILGEGIHLVGGVTPLPETYFSIVVGGTVRYVEEGGTGSGTSAGSPAGDLTAVVAAAAAGTDVRVGAGTYSNAITIPGNVAVYGGYDPSFNYSDPESFESRITDNESATVTLQATSGIWTSAIDGFTLANTSTTGGAEGVRVVRMNSNAHAVVSNNRILGNIAPVGDNVAEIFGIECTGASVLLVDNFIDPGQASARSAGILLDNCGGWLVDNEIAGGVGADDTQGIVCDSEALPWASLHLYANQVDGGLGADSVGIDLTACGGWLANNVVNGGGGTASSTGVRLGTAGIAVNNTIWGGLSPGPVIAGRTMDGGASWLNNLLLVTPHGASIEDCLSEDDYTSQFDANVMAGCSVLFRDNDGNEVVDVEVLDDYDFVDRCNALGCGKSIFTGNVAPDLLPAAIVDSAGHLVTDDLTITRGGEENYGGCGLQAVPQPCDEVGEDFDGQGRDLVHPSIGADEAP